MPQSNKHICFSIWASEPGNYHKLVFVLIQLMKSLVILSSFGILFYYEFFLIDFADDLGGKGQL
jgi:hypothetical protein